jgi:hypothetical protein
LRGAKLTVIVAKLVSEADFLWRVGPFFGVYCANKEEAREVRTSEASGVNLSLELPERMPRSVTRVNPRYLLTPNQPLPVLQRKLVAVIAVISLISVAVQLIVD